MLPDNRRRFVFAFRLEIPPPIRSRMPQLDLKWFARGGSVAIVSIAISQIAQAVLMLVYPESAPLATCLIAVAKGLQWLGAPVSVTFTAAVLILTSLEALFGACFRIGYVRLLLFTCQQIILTLMLGGGVLAALGGRYLDGTAVASPHIVTDQVCLLSPLWLIHVSAIIRRCRDPNG